MRASKILAGVLAKFISPCRGDWFPAGRKGRQVYLSMSGHCPRPWASCPAQSGHSDSWGKDPVGVRSQPSYPFLC